MNGTGLEGACSEVPSIYGLSESRAAVLCRQCVQFLPRNVRMGIICFAFWEVGGTRDFQERHCFSLSGTFHVCLSVQSVGFPLPGCLQAVVDTCLSTGCEWGKPVSISLKKIRQDKVLHSCLFTFPSAVSFLWVTSALA